jgi:hypothetical protein
MKIVVSTEKNFQDLFPGSVSSCHMGPSGNRKENEPGEMDWSQGRGWLVSAARSSKDERNRPFAPTDGDRSVR